MDTAIAIAQQTMQEFSRETGLLPGNRSARRYLWTDAFAVCNFLELYRLTQDQSWLDKALQLVDQVHRTLGRHRADDPRCGWISGLDQQEGGLHPTRGGLRIGKRLNERKDGDPPDERLDWDRDGQYYHYLTKWMHALQRVGRVTADAKYLTWALELAQVAHARFSYAPSWGGPKRLYWKMNVDLSRPQVHSMGQHDPLDGLVTYCELQAAARESGATIDLRHEIADLAAICRATEWSTDDPLGLGGLLWVASAMVQLSIRNAFQETWLLPGVVDAALVGIRSLAAGTALERPAVTRLPFRELGLALGLKGVAPLQRWIKEHPMIFATQAALPERLAALAKYLPLAEKIESFWLGEKNRAADTWMEHREINVVMLATSLTPDGFLSV